jgi:hypothetical protein
VIFVVLFCKEVEDFLPSVVKWNACWKNQDPSNHHLGGFEKTAGLMSTMEEAVHFLVLEVCFVVLIVVL